MPLTGFTQAGQKTVLRLIELNYSRKTTGSTVTQNAHNSTLKTTLLVFAD